MNSNCIIQLRDIKNQRGLSLVELMIAMLAGLLVMTGMVALMMSNQQVYRFNDNLARIQENGRFALDTLTYDIRMAGFTGCSRFLPSAPGAIKTLRTVSNHLTNPTTTWWENFGYAAPTAAGTKQPATITGGYTIIGYDGNDVFPGRGTGTTAGDRSSTIGRRTDAIILLQGGGNQYAVVSQNDAKPSITLDQPPTASVLTICDASTTEILQVQSVSGNEATLNVALSKNYAPTATIPTTATVMDYTPVAFYLGVGNSGAASDRSLYRMSFQGGAMVSEELVENVESMQIFYGVDTNGDGAIDPPYLSAFNVTDWNQVLAVRVKLLLKSREDNILDSKLGKQTLFFPVQSDKSNDDKAGGEGECGSLACLPATDYRAYQVFSTTVGLRNRLP